MNQPDDAVSETRVAIYLSSWIVTGTLHLRARVRLTDILNSWVEEFLCLEDPILIQLQGEQKEPIREASPMFIHRQQILLLHEISTPDERAVKTVGPDARVAKVALPIRAYAGPLRVGALFYLPQFSEMSAYLNRVGETFLPLTSVSLSFPFREDLEPVQVSFALMNKNSLVIVQTGPSEPAGEPQD